MMQKSKKYQDLLRTHLHRALRSPVLWAGPQDVVSTGSRTPSQRSVECPGFWQRLLGEQNEGFIPPNKLCSPVDNGLLSSASWSTRFSTLSNAEIGVRAALNLRSSVCCLLVERRCRVDPFQQASATDAIQLVQSQPYYHTDPETGTCTTMLDDARSQLINMSITSAWDKERFRSHFRGCMLHPLLLLQRMAPRLTQTQ